MTQFNEPNRFCGECPIWLCIGEPGVTCEQNDELIHKCRECKSWTKNDIQLLNKDNVGQCWHCQHQVQSEEIYNIYSNETILAPYCSYRNLLIIANKKEDDICPFFIDRGGML